jgi:hypothetical protein
MFPNMNFNGNTIILKRNYYRTMFNNPNIAIFVKVFHVFERDDNYSLHTFFLLPRLA